MSLGVARPARNRRKPARAPVPAPIGNRRTGAPVAPAQGRSRPAHAAGAVRPLPRRRLAHPPSTNTTRGRRHDRRLGPRERRRRHGHPGPGAVRGRAHRRDGAEVGRGPAAHARARRPARALRPAVAQVAGRLRRPGPRRGAGALARPCAGPGRRSRRGRWRPATRRWRRRSGRRGCRTGRCWPWSEPSRRRTRWRGTAASGRSGPWTRSAASSAPGRGGAGWRRCTSTSPAPRSRRSGSPRAASEFDWAHGDEIPFGHDTGDTHAHTPVARRAAR